MYKKTFIISKKHIPPSVMRIWLFWKYDKQNKLWCDLSEEETDKIIETAKETNMKWVQVYNVTNSEKLKQTWLYTICQVNHNEIIYSPIATIIWNIKEHELENIDLLIINSSNPWSWKSYDYKKLSELKIRKPFLVAWWVNKNSISEIFKQVPNCIWVDIASGVDNGENVDEGMVREFLEGMRRNIYFKIFLNMFLYCKLFYF